MRIALALLALGGLAVAAGCRSDNGDSSSYEVEDARTVTLEVSGMT